MSHVLLFCFPKIRHIYNLHAFCECMSIVFVSLMFEYININIPRTNTLLQKKIIIYLKKFSTTSPMYNIWWIQFFCIVVTIWFIEGCNYIIFYHFMPSCAMIVWYVTKPSFPTTIYTRGYGFIGFRPCYPTTTNLDFTTTLVLFILLWTYLDIYDFFQVTNFFLPKWSM